MTPAATPSPEVVVDVRGLRKQFGGHVVIDGAYHTSVYNVFAAGDLVPGPELGVAAAADGAVAGLAIHKSLVPESRKLKKRPPPEHAEDSSGDERHAHATAATTTSAPTATAWRPVRWR